jgi:rod shape-determining protein MreB
MARNNRLSLGRDLAIDLGTANTLIYARGHGIVLDEPSVVAVNVNDGRPVAVGLEAKRMIGRTPGHIRAIRPLADGVIADFDVCEKMLRYFIQKVHASKWSKPRMIICVPSGITGVEQRAVQEAAEYAGARKPVHIIEEPMAAAIGADLPVHEPSGNMIVDIGGGTTEVAVISLGGIVTAQSMRVAGDELDDAIMQYVKKEFSLAIGDRTAEEIKIQMGSAWPMDEELTADIRGRDLISGLPRTIQLTTEHVREAVAEPVSAIIHARQDAARARCRHHARRHHAHRWWRAARRARASARSRDRHADPPGQRAALQRGHRIGKGVGEHRRHARADVARRRRVSRHRPPPWAFTRRFAVASSLPSC